MTIIDVFHWFAYIGQLHNRLLYIALSNNGCEILVDFLVVLKKQLQVYLPSRVMCDIECFQGTLIYMTVISYFQDS